MFIVWYQSDDLQYHPTLHFIPWSLDLFIRVSIELHAKSTVLQPFRRIAFILHIAIFVSPGNHFPLSQHGQVKPVKCLGQGHTIVTMSQNWDGRYFSKIHHQARFEPAPPGAVYRQRQSASLQPLRHVPLSRVYELYDVSVHIYSVIWVYANKCHSTCSRLAGVFSSLKVNDFKCHSLWLLKPSHVPVMFFLLWHNSYCSAVNLILPFILYTYLCMDCLETGTIIISIFLNYTLSL